VIGPTVDYSVRTVYLTNCKATKRTRRNYNGTKEIFYFNRIDCHRLLCNIYRCIAKWRLHTYLRRSQNIAMLSFQMVMGKE